MDYGLVTYDNVGALNFSSVMASSNYFDTSINASATTSLGSVQFQSAGAVFCPTGPSSWRYNMYSSSAADRFWFTVPGCVNAGGTQFYAPSINYLAGPSNYRTLRIETSVNCNIKRFGKLAPTSDTGYGFTTVSPDGTLAVSNTYKAFYVQPDASQSKLRTATATNIQTGTTGTSSYTQIRPQTITFDEAYDVPPLIFVTESAGLIAFNGMITNAAGKFVGASICAAPGMAPWTGFPGFPEYYPYSAINASTFSFTYFLVHQNVPPNGTPSSHGLEVYNASGELTFSSKYFVPAITKQTVSLPYTYLTTGSRTASNWSYPNASTITKTAKQGVCINNFFSVTGCITEAPTPPYTYAECALHLPGRYINVGTTSVTVTGALTSVGYALFAVLNFNEPQVADFHSGNISTMDVFLANYEY